MYLQLFFQLTSFHIQISSQLSSFLVWFFPPFLIRPCSFQTQLSAQPVSFLTHLFSPFLIQHYFGILSVTQCSFQLIPFQLELSSALDQYFRWMPYSFQTQLSAQPVIFFFSLFQLPFFLYKKTEKKKRKKKMRKKKNGLSR